MDFSVICPNDGPIEVGLENISTIIFRGLGAVIIAFRCPRCGSDIHVVIQLPEMFIAAVELEAEGPLAFDEDMLDFTLFGRGAEPTYEPPTPGEQRRIDKYCEYFRRQLASAEDVDAVLAEIDNRPRKGGGR